MVPGINSTTTSSRPSSDGLMGFSSLCSQFPPSNGAITTTIANTPAPATRNVSRGLDSVAMTPPTAKPTPGIAAPIDSSTLITRACIDSAVSSCTALIAATHWTPLPAPPRTEAAQATARVGAAASPR